MRKERKKETVRVWSSQELLIDPFVSFCVCLRPFSLYLHSAAGSFASSKVWSARQDDRPSVSLARAAIIMSGASSQLIRDSKLPSAILICAVLLALYTSARIKYVFPTRSPFATKNVERSKLALRTRRVSRVRSVVLLRSRWRSRCPRRTIRGSESSLALSQCYSAVFVVCPALHPFLLLLLQQLCRKLIPSQRFFSLLSSPTFWDGVVVVVFWAWSLLPFSFVFVHTFLLVFAFSSTLDSIVSEYLL